jgi:hypothetical protein
MVQGGRWHDGCTVTALAQGSGGGFGLTLELDSDHLLPGRLVDGRLRVHARDADSIRGARITLVGTETWRYDQTTTDSEGHTRTETRTAQDELPKIPVALLGPTDLGAGETRDLPFQLPVPSMGPATFEGTELRVDWALRANLDIGGFDPSAELPVRILQPTSLLRAGAVDVGQFALFDEAAVEADGLAGSIRLEPAPLCIGAPFRGTLTMTQGEARRVQEVRLELRVTAKATVGGGREETTTLWSGRLADPGDFGGEARAYPFDGVLDDLHLPTVRTPHGRADGSFHVVVAVAWAPDPHLVRDIAICSTTEI